MPIEIRCVGLSANGPVQLQILAHGQAERAGQAGLQRGDADLAIALHAMAVTDREQRALIEHRQIQRGAGTKRLVIHVAAESARHDRALPAPCGRRAPPP